MSEAVARSLRFEQREILQDIARLHLGGAWFECDLTFGNGQFWKGLEAPRLAFDIDPQVDGVVEADSRQIPVAASSLSSMVFDPPFLTYVRQGRSGNGGMVMARRFAGYWRYDELIEHYTATILEAARTLRSGGIFVVKCQDIIHNHKMHATHVNVIRWAEDSGFRLADIFVLGANHRMPSPNRTGKQKHARIFHSYFLVFQRGKTK